MFVSQIVDYGAKVRQNSFKMVDFKSLNPFKNASVDKLTSILKKATTLAKKRALLLVLVIAALSLFAIVRVKGTPQNPLTIAGSQTDFSPQTQISVNRKFEIPIRNAKGADTGDKLAVTLTTIDSSKKILIQGKPATARDTKAFLILNLEIENSITNQLTVRPVDFIRLVDEQNRSFAPDVHNNEVTVEPVSIKKTRVGFVVDEEKKNFKFFFGEISGEKQTIEISI
ncbi:hypothetical protein A3C33_04735 [Candidatus Curtissbacteria bacterium RIFCSPHIGHO2_02_FULL_42_58]|nr:MAG: hypothetical protein A3C33_04735 [Candidatus Curtissbacteria bacterium RIFCSPHIGHO2_02_FULL_42_58]